MPAIDSAHAAQIKSRDRVCELAEVYTHASEVNAMLDLVADTLPSDEEPDRIDRKFFEPAFMRKSGVSRDTTPGLRHTRGPSRAGAYRSRATRPYLRPRAFNLEAPALYSLGG